MVKSRGEKFAPEEVESVLNELYGVVEATVAGVPAQLLGNYIKAIFVRKSRELSEREVLAHCRTHLEDVMIPKSSSGKVLKQELV